MENNNKQIELLKELREKLQEAQKLSIELGATSKTQTLKRMVEVIAFDLFKLGVTN